MSSLQRCSHYRGVLTTIVSSLQRCPHYRVSSLQRCPHYRVSSLQRCPHYRGVLTAEVSSLQRCSLQRCPHYRGVLTAEVSSLQRCPLYKGVLFVEVVDLPMSAKCSYSWLRAVIRGFPPSMSIALVRRHCGQFCKTNLTKAKMTNESHTMLLGLGF